MADSKRIIVVMHATSKQGTSVVLSLLQNNKFHVKAITRDANGDNAKQLAAKGAEMVEADATNAIQLRAAFDGAYGVFAVTVALGGGGVDGGYERELEQGKVMADAAAAAGVKVFVFSALEDVEKLSKGKWRVPHFSSKAHVMDYIEAEHRDMIGIYPAVGHFYTNVIEYVPPRSGPDGVLTFSLPIRGDVPFPWLNPYTATGPVVTAAFTEPDKYCGFFIPVYDEVLTCNQLVETFTQITGVKARYHQVSTEDMMAAGMPEPMADWQSQVYNCCTEFGYYSPDRDMELVHKINPHPETWAEFLKNTGFDGSQKLADIRRTIV